MVRRREASSAQLQSPRARCTAAVHALSLNQAEEATASTVHHWKLCVGQSVICHRGCQETRTRCMWECRTKHSVLNTKLLEKVRYVLVRSTKLETQLGL